MLLDSPAFIWLTILSFVGVFFVLFFTMFPKSNGKQQINAATSTKVAKENSSACTMLGFLKKLPKGEPIPNECVSCRKLVECSMAKRAFEWYIGQDSGAPGTHPTKF